MKGRDKQTPEVPAADTFHSLSEFSAKATGSPHAGDPHSMGSLRQKAEAQVREREERSLEELADLSPESMRRILHELRVHQIELEMQNEELRRVQAALEAERTRYFHIFDLAPVGYVTLNAEGLIVEANLTAANLLGMARRELTGKPLSNFIIREDRDLHYQLRKRLADSGATQTCEVRMGKTAGTAFWAHLSATAVPDPDGGPACRVVLSDISERKQAETALRESESMLKESQDLASLGCYVFDIASDHWSRSEVLDTILGIDATYERSAAAWAALIHSDDRAMMTDYFHQEMIERHQHIDKEYRIVRHNDQAERWLHGLGKLEFDSVGRPVKMIGAILDITERKRRSDIHEFLARTGGGAAQEPFFNALARHLALSLDMDFVCIDRLEGDGLNARTVAVWCDGCFEDNVTYALRDTPCGDVVGQTVCCFPANVCQFFPRDQVLQDLRAESYIGSTLWGHDGHPIGLIALISRRPLANREQAEATLKLVAERAATELERMEYETALNLALTEKTSLVMEIHHRVKNNLAIMIGLIKMQAHQIKHPEALAALADTKARLFSMSLLHEMLYSAGRMDQVEIQSYMQRLCSHISQSHGLSARGIQIQNSPSAPLTVGIDQAVPCGLIVSELISNAIKHAFPNDRQGKMTIALVLTPPDIVTLRVTDDGIGLPDGVQIGQIGKLGLSLVDALTRQLQGTLEIQREPGTSFEIRFPHQPTAPA